MKILVIDDDTMCRNLLKHFLHHAGHIVEEASDGECGWEQFVSANPRFDLVLSDCDMPNLSGLQLIERIRQIDSKVQVILVSGNNDFFGQDKLPKFGVHTVLWKPFPLESLKEVIQKAEHNQETLSGSLQ